MFITATTKVHLRNHSHGSLSPPTITHVPPPGPRRSPLAPKNPYGGVGFLLNSPPPMNTNLRFLKIFDRLHPPGSSRNPSFGLPSPPPSSFVPPNAHHQELHSAATNAVVKSKSVILLTIFPKKTWIALTTPPHFSHARASMFPASSGFGHILT